MKNGIFITGTDTGIGKTTVSSLILAALKATGKRSFYFKPIQTGTELDTETVTYLAGQDEVHWPKPTYFFPQPRAPYLAAALSGGSIELEKVRQDWEKWGKAEKRETYWVVEGAGGLLVPLTAKESVRDLIQIMNLPLVIVSSTRLGTMNHTFLTIEAARSSNLEIRGVILSGDEDPGLERILEEISGVPVIARIPHLPEVSPEIVQTLGIEIFPENKLRAIYGSI